MLDFSVRVRDFVKYSKGLLEFSLKLNVVLKYFFNIVFVVVIVYVLSKVGSNLFSGGATHEAYYKRSLIYAAYLVKLKVEVELEDLFLELYSISIVKVRPSNLTIASLSFV